MNRVLARMRALARRKVRDSTGLFVLEGPRLVADALDAGVAIVDVAFTPDFVASQTGAQLVARLERSGARLVQVPRADLERAADTVTPAGVIAVGTMPGALGSTDADAGAGVGPGAGPRMTVVLDRVQDPGNVGAIIRTAASAGASRLIVGPGCADPFGPKSLRASMGAAFRLPVSAVEDWAELLERLKADGAKTVGTVAAGGSCVYDEDLSGPVALLFGNEAEGLAPDLVAAADSLVTIPMAREVESLNVAAAAAVVLFEAVRQRRVARGPLGCGPPERVV